MPELPEVQTVVMTLAPQITGRRIARVVHLRADMATPENFDLKRALRGRTIARLSRRGKRIVFHLDDGNLFFVHLGMTGRLSVEPRAAQRLIHTHLILQLDGNPHARAAHADAKHTRAAHTGGDQLRFRDPRRFGEIRWLGCASCDEKMGIEPLTMRTAQLASKLTRTTRAIKNALMDQSVVAGLGNIYVDESLFDARIHPLTPADTLSSPQVAQLTKSIKRVLNRAITHRGSTLRDYADANGNAGAFQRLHRVYDRNGKPCPRCKTPIERIVLGGRSTHFCPQCQSRRRPRVKRRAVKERAVKP